MAGRSDPIPDEAAEWLAEEGVAGAAPRRSFPAGRSETRVAAQPAFVLHSYPYRETSLIIDVFTPDYGRMALVAKGGQASAFGVACGVADVPAAVAVLERSR